MSVSPIDKSSRNLYGLYTLKQASANTRPTLADKIKPDYSLNGGLTDIGFLSQSLEGKKIESFSKRDSKDDRLLMTSSVDRLKVADRSEIADSVTRAGDA